MAIVTNMAIAGLAGTTISILLDSNNIDPAVASSVFITTITDVVGFFVFRPGCIDSTLSSLHIPFT